MEKMKLIRKVLISDLGAPDKALLTELLMCSDDQGQCWPSVERLCKARGIKHEKNFKGADFYLPGLVTKVKKGRKNYYTINTPAVAGLSEATVAIKHTPNTPARADDTPAVEGVYTPARADNTPSWEGANSTSNNTIDSTKESTTVVADAPTALPNLEVKETDSSLVEGSPNHQSDLTDSTNTDTPAQEGVYTASKYRVDWMRLTDDERQYFNDSGATPDQLREAVYAYCHGSTGAALGWYDKAEKSLRKAGVEVKTLLDW